MQVDVDDRVRPHWIGVVGTATPGLSVYTVSTGEVWQSLESQICSEPLVMMSSCWVVPRLIVQLAGPVFVIVMLIIGFSVDAYVALSATGTSLTFAGKQDAPAAGATDGPVDCTTLGFALLVFAGAAAPDPDWPGFPTIRTMMTMTASTPSATRSLRRQYTLGGWGPTGVRNVDMRQG